MAQQRTTRQRQLVLEAVLSRRDHPSADEIYLDVRERDGRISRGTVYRNLKLLAENGEVNQVKVPGADRFDCRLDPHYHLLCTGCGAVRDLTAPYQPEGDRKIAGETGFLIQRHRVIFEGLCPDCQEKEKNE